ncbi:sulfatase-like hydrolase/transferase [Aureibaculum conchae]|uniref:sulfatase-like hydrolase/transferase n=1 Tax=Aureibaculum sp. 2308TA14-22 TaxID=3108392 RepID=UPI003395A943
MKIFISFLILVCLGSVNAQNRNQNDRPNFILIVADDLGYGDLGITGSKQIKTPNIDRLAKTGMFFTEGYVSSAVCSPSRAGLLTGINQVEFGYDNNLGGNQPGFDPNFLGLPIEQKTIANHLKPLGYVNGLIGKWHLGYEDQFHPLKRGFDEFWGYRGGGHDYFKANDSKRGYKAAIECNYKTPQKITYITDDKGDECVDFIKRNHDKPFFLYASFNAPHTPMQATKEDLELYSNIKDKKRRTYAAMVHRLDVNIGKIIVTLKEQQLSKNTLIVFISDNGGPVFTNGSINAPFNGKKGILLEGGIHVPFIMNWQGKIAAGNNYSNAVSSLDLAPTFVELAGGKINEEINFSGVNLMPFVLGENIDIPHKDLKWRFTISAAIREGDWKLIRLPDRLPSLYHLPTDVSEQNNVSLKNLDITKRLLKKLGIWDVKLPHPVFLEGAVWKKRQLKHYDDEYFLHQPE